MALGWEMSGACRSCSFFEFCGFVLECLSTAAKVQVVLGWEMSGVCRSRCFCEFCGFVLECVSTAAKGSGGAGLGDEWCVRALVWLLFLVIFVLESVSTAAKGASDAGLRDEWCMSGSSVVFFCAGRASLGA